MMIMMVMGNRLFLVVLGSEAPDHRRSDADPCKKTSHQRGRRPRAELGHGKMAEAAEGAWGNPGSLPGGEQSPFPHLCWAWVSWLLFCINYPLQLPSVSLSSIEEKMHSEVKFQIRLFGIPNQCN